MNEFAFGPDRITSDGSRITSAVKPLFTHAGRTLCSPLSPLTFSPIILIMVSLSAGRPAAAQAVHTLREFSISSSTEVWGENAASNATNLSVSSPKIRLNAFLLFLYHPFFARPDNATAPISWVEGFALKDLTSSRTDSIFVLSLTNISCSSGDIYFKIGPSPGTAFFNALILFCSSGFNA